MTLSERTRPVNIRIYEADIEFLQFYLGRGWSSQIRDIIRELVAQLKAEPPNILEELKKADSRMCIPCIKSGAEPKSYATDNPFANCPRCGTRLTKL